jgi:hypothetical protein
MEKMLYFTSWGFVISQIPPGASKRPDARPNGVFRISSLKMRIYCMILFYFVVPAVGRPDAMHVFFFVGVSPPISFIFRIPRLKIQNLFGRFVCSVWVGFGGLSP